MNMKKADPRASHAHNMFKMLGVPQDAYDSLPIITVMGGEYAEIEHHCGVLQLSECCLRVYSNRGIIRIEGEKLHVESMNNDKIRIHGSVKCAVLE